jgi:alkylated DNA repair dioxygenase AlkB
MTRASRAGQEELFESGASRAAGREQLEPGAFVLRAFALDEAPALLDAIQVVARAAPFRHMTTARGLRMSVAMTNCGDAGWLSDRSGYRYDAIDPETRRPWPAMPDVFRASRPARRKRGGLRGVRSRCVPHQPLRARHTTDAPSGPG